MSSALHATPLEVERRVSDRADIDQLLDALRRGISVVVHVEVEDPKQIEPLAQYAAGLTAAVGGELRQDGPTLTIHPYQRGTHHSDPADAEWSTYAAAVAAEVFERITSNSESAADRIRAVDESPGDVADRLVAALPLAGVWDHRIGPFYDTAALRRFSGASRQALHARARNRSILAVRTGDGTVLYPAFQFDKDARPLTQLRAVLEALDPEDLDPWGDALWLCTSAEALGGQSPAQALYDGRSDDVLAIAQRIGAAWSE